MLVRCDRSSRQYRWLNHDLATSPASCTLVAFHHPRFSSGPHGDDAELLLLRPIWRLLYRRGADLVLNEGWFEGEFSVLHHARQF